MHAKTLSGVTRDDFIGHFESLFFSSNTSRLDIQMVTEHHKEAHGAAWDVNAEAEMFAKHMKRTLHKGSIEDFKKNASYYSDAVVDAFKKL